MKVNKYPSELLFFWLAFFLALALRLFKLGAAALTDGEATWALQALHLARGQTVTVGAQPAYILLTTLLFSIFKDTNFLARLFPALAGSLLVWLPYYFRSSLGEARWMRNASLIMAFGLAIDPGLVSLSRQIGSPMPALVFSLLFITSLYHRRMAWSGVFAALALLSGQAFLQGALILLVSWWLYHVLARRFTETSTEASESVPLRQAISGEPIRVAAIAFVLTILIAGTLFLQVPQGLGALADTLSAFLKTWTNPSGVPVYELPGSLLAYQPLVLIFAVYAFVQIWESKISDLPTRRRITGLWIWVLLGLLFPMLAAGRQVGDVAWSLIPLWALAAMALSRAFLNEDDRITRVVAFCLSALLFVLSVVGWINLLSIGRYQVSVGIYWAIIIGAFLLGLVALLLVHAGWSSRAAKLGVIWSLCLLMGLQLVSTTWGMVIVRQNGAQELWIPQPTTSKTDLLLSTLMDLSNWHTGLSHQVEIVSMAESPALGWALRDFPNARFQDTLSAAESPPVVITLKGTDEPQLAENYRGQDFTWRLHMGSQTNIINWLAFRQVPLQQDQIIVWARVDLFPGGSLSSNGTVTP